MKQVIAMAAIAVLGFTEVRAQGYVDQEATYQIAESQIGDIDQVDKATWTVYEYKDHIPKNNKGQWTEWLYYIDSLPGFYQGERRYIVEMANRVTGENFKTGQKLLVPTSFQQDFRAYSPYPFHYDAANNMPKLLVIDKYTQTFGAYEQGKLVRWGLVSTGREDDLTAPGKYNFNWKAEYRQSSEAPPGEVWELYWMFNINAKSGVHVHQYALPIAAPASHGCIRMSEADAKWNFNWANGCQMAEDGGLKRNGTPVLIINNNPVGRPAHWLFDNDGTVTSLVKLPDSFDNIRAGTYAQNAAKWDSGW